MSESVLVEIDTGIAVVTLNKPEKLNAWDGPMRARLTQALDEFNADDSVRAVILTGAGDRAFSACPQWRRRRLSLPGRDAH